MKPQSAVEYLVILGIVLAFVIPIWVYVSTYHRQTSDQISVSYAGTAVKQIVNTADLVSSQGYPAKLQIMIYIPDKIQNVTIFNNTIRIRVLTTSGLSDFFASSRSDLNGTVPTTEGLYTLNIEAADEYVQINVAP